MSEPFETDTGDKVTASLTFKRALPNYQNITMHAGVSITRRDGESEEEVWKRAWKIAGRELDAANGRADRILSGEKLEDD